MNREENERARSQDSWYAHIIREFSFLVDMQSLSVCTSGEVERAAKEVTN
jgi:hypothetical protein